MNKTNTIISVLIGLLLILTMNVYVFADEELANELPDSTLMHFSVKNIEDLKERIGYKELKKQILNIMHADQREIEKVFLKDITSLDVLSSIGIDTKRPISLSIQDFNKMIYSIHFNLSSSDTMRSYLEEFASNVKMTIENNNVGNYEILEFYSKYQTEYPAFVVGLSNNSMIIFVAVDDTKNTKNLYNIFFKDLVSNNLSSNGEYRKISRASKNYEIEFYANTKKMFEINKVDRFLDRDFTMFFDNLLKNG